MFTERVLRCCDCASDFVFTVGEQEFFNSKGLTNEPKRCANCRVVTRLRRSGRGLETLSSAVCAKCESSFMLPFKPLGYKPTYCNTCFRVHRAEMEAAQQSRPAVVAPIEQVPVTA
ncbi:MAG: zinc-ribbon domain containing protein [Candidatus Melainabacteria bacterium]|nr:zinc-ribbon domain containing protein [Candidatus Melainabacteria bacterium]